MALDDNISALATAIGTKIKEVEASIGNGGGGTRTQNVFIQEAEPTIGTGTSALWIQKSADGSITFNLIEN